MFEVRYLLLIILLGICVYLIYNLYSYQTKHLDKLKDNIIETIELECEELNDKIENIEKIVDKKITDCNKKIKDLYSLQNKINVVTKMNGQSIINQYNQYDDVFEENIDADLNDEFKNQIFNSAHSNQVVNSANNCFIKINQIKNDEKEMFYMSPVENTSNNKKNKFINDSIIELENKESSKKSSKKSSK